MEKHGCKLCFRRFSSGRALGGHMRSHVTPRPTRAPPLPSSPSASASSSSAVAAGLGYGLRDNPRKSFRLVDQEFSTPFASGVGSSFVVQDHESETESSLPPRLGRRSKRTRSRPETMPPAEAEPLSSISDVSPEQNIARCLMLLSRDSWSRSSGGKKAEDRQSDGWDEAALEEEDHDDEGISGAARPRRSGRRSKYQCSTCKKSFRSYQALGGTGRATRKVAGGGSIAMAGCQIGREVSSKADVDQNLSPHHCPICSRVFVSTQALGSHKRSHHTASSSPAAANAPSTPLCPPPLFADSFTSTASLSKLTSTDIWSKITLTDCPSKFASTEKLSKRRLASSATSAFSLDCPREPCRRELR